MDPIVRFDDLVSGIAFVFDGPLRTIVATELDQVSDALSEVEKEVAGGNWAAGFMTYEAAPGLDPTLSVRPPQPDTLPLVWFGIFSDHRPEPVLAARATRPAPYSVSAWTPSIDRPAYDAAFESIRGHIAAGDTYQVNQTFRLHSAFAGDAFEMYRDLALSQRGAYSAYFDLGRFAHRVLWNGDASRVESYLESQEEQLVCIRGSGCCVLFDQGERIWTESSYKYEPEGIVAIGEGSGFARRAQWIEPQSRFALTLFEAE